jgi:hypothetical protein
LGLSSIKSSIKTIFEETMLISPPPQSNSVVVCFKLLCTAVAIGVLAGLVACGGTSSTPAITGGGGGGGGTGGGNANSSLLFAADFNSLPGVWCPTDSQGKIAAVKTLRIWDSGMKWSDVETLPNQFDWTSMDNTLNNLVTNPNCPMGVIYTVGSTPQWASACASQPDVSTCLPGPTSSGFGGGTQCANAENYSCTPPSDVNADGTGADLQFQTFISNVADRYSGKIAYYEVWNEADSPNFWCPSGGGSPSTCGTGNASLAVLVRMAWDMYNIIHCADSSAQVLSPSFHGNTALTWMPSWVNTSISAPAVTLTLPQSGKTCSWQAANVTGKQTFDITNFHGRPGGNENPDPTQFLGIYNNVVTEVNNDGLPTKLFDDENGYLGIADSPNAATQAGYVAISYVLRAQVQPYPILLSSWYSWNSPQAPLQGQLPGTAYDVVAGWLSGSIMSPCTITGALYSCPGKSSSGKAFTIMWDMNQTCGSATSCTTSTQPAPAGYSTYTDLTGTQNSISGGGAPVGYQPILLE